MIDPVWGYPYNDYRGKLPVIQPGPRNPLSTRWKGFTPEQHGIHGTNRPDSLGKVISHGCVRMHTRHAEELFELVNVGTPVEVGHDTVLLRVDRRRALVLAASFPKVYRRGRPGVAGIRAELERMGVRARLSPQRIRALQREPDGRYRVIGWLLPSGTR